MLFETSKDVNDKLDYMNTLYFYVYCINHYEQESDF